jgi:hypothetical protein
MLGGDRTKEKLAVLFSLMALSLLFTSTTALAVEETVKVRFYFIDSGSCLVVRGDTNSPLWQGVGNGALALSGKADGEYYEQPAGEITFKGYMMHNLLVGGSLLLRWTETDNSKHWVTVTFYSTATSLGVYFNDPLVLGTISMASNKPEDYIRFKGIYYDGARIQVISGLALLMIIQYSEKEYVVAMQLLNGPQPIQINSMILAVWSNIGMTVPGFPEIPAARVFKWNVEIMH